MELPTLCSFEATLFSTKNEIRNSWVYLLISCCSFKLGAGLTGLVSLNVSNSRITNDGLQHLKPLKNLRSLTLESCKVTAPEIRKLQTSALPNLISFRPE